MDISKYTNSVDEGMQAEGVTDILGSLGKNLPQNKRKTLTFDNGRKFADHKMIEYETGTTVYCAHPYHSWER